MNLLYTENSIIGRLFQFFLEYFPDATRPTQKLLAWFLLAYVTLETVPSIRYMHRHFLSSVSPSSLNCYYRALANHRVDDSSLRCKTAQLVCSMIPPALEQEPVFLSIDDTIVEKFGRKFESVSLLHDHALHTGKPFVNGHCFVSLVMCVPVLVQKNRQSPQIRYVSVPIGYAMWVKGENTKLSLAGDLIDEVMPLLGKRQVILSFDSWYAKHDLIARVLKHPNLYVICNARSDTAMFELPKPLTGRRGRPQKRGAQLHHEDFTLSYSLGKYKVGHRLVKTNIFGDRTVHAYVSRSEKGSTRLFFSTLEPMELHLSCAWQENPELRQASSKDMEYYALKCYKFRWNIETSYYEQKSFWSLGQYMIRNRIGIVHVMNLANTAHSAMKILPYKEETLAEFQEKSPQELRFHLSEQIRQQVFFANLARRAQTAINSSKLLNALSQLLREFGVAA